MEGVVLAEGWRGGEHLRDRQVLALVSISCPVPRQEANDPPVLLPGHCFSLVLTSPLPPGCAVLLGMEGGAISDAQLSASSVYYGFLGLQRWGPELARLNNHGIVNAWTSSNYDKSPWIQVLVEGLGAPV